MQVVPTSSAGPTSKMSCQVQVARHTVVTVVVSGELDRWTAPSLEATLDAVRVVGAAHVELDCAGVSFVDHRGLAVVDAFADRLHLAGGSLTVIRPSRAMLRCLELTDGPSPLRWQVGPPAG